MSAGVATAASAGHIVGVVSCIPRKVVGNDYFRSAFGEKAEDIEKLIGVKERRWAAEGQTTSDLCEHAANHLMETLQWDPETVDGLVFVSQTPDYRLPATACALQSRLGIRPGTIAFDVNLGCSGYPYGLWLAMMCLEGGSAKRILLLVGDTISKTVDPEDRATAMLFGDAGTATALERRDGINLAPHRFLLGSDGRGERNLIIPQGGYRTDLGAAEPFVDRKLDALYMDGGEVFGFTLKAIPPLVSETLALSGQSLDDHDAFLFHQANSFMVRHLAKKCKLPAEKVPINLDRYGNTSSASIPLLITTDMAETLLEKTNRIAMFGFGVGYSWASMTAQVGPLACAETIEV